MGRERAFALLSLSAGAPWKTGGVGFMASWEKFLKDYNLCYPHQNLSA